jgi:hypothetical protein
MWLGREVRFGTILLSCVAGLCSGACARGTGKALDLPRHHLGSEGPASVVLSGSLDSVHLLSCSSFSGSFVSSYPGVPNCPFPAMALPDGPGAVFLGVLGFMCVSLARNRRIWIGLCLFVLSNGRLGVARLSRMGVAAPEFDGPDLLSETGSDHVLWHQLACRVPDRPAAWTGMEFCVEILGMGPRVRPRCLGRSFGDRGEKGLLSQVDTVCDGPRGMGTLQVVRGDLCRPVSNEFVELARPPPGRS